LQKAFHKKQIAEVFEDYAGSVGSLTNLFILYGIGALLNPGKKLSSRLKKTSVFTIGSTEWRFLMLWEIEIKIKRNKIWLPFH
jgi:hypothetical protein